MAKRDTQTRLAEQRARNELAVERLKARRLRALHQASNSPRPGFGVSARYDAATRTRLRPGPRAQGGSAQRHLTPTVRSALRRDCQDLERNSSIARIVIRRAQQLIVGDGPIVTSTTDDQPWNDEADRLWNLWTEGEESDVLGMPDLAGVRSFDEMLSGLVLAWCTSGEELWVQTNRGSIQTIESERVTNGGMTAPTKGGGQTVDGVELDAAGAPVAYQVASWDEYGNLRTGEYRTVNARYAKLIGNPIGVKTGVVRAEPALQAVIDRLERMESFDISTAVAAEIATRFCGVVHTENPADTMSSWTESTPDQPTDPGTAQRDQPQHVEIQPGQLTFLDNKPGTKVTALKPEFPTTNFTQYMAWHLMVVSAELGLPIVASFFDASGLSWSNIKALLSLSMRSIEPSQARLARVVRWVREWKIAEWMAAGYLPARDDYTSCTVVFPRAPVVDFASEVDGYKSAIDGRLMTREQAIQALGTGTFEQVSEVLAAEEKRLSDLGIPAVNMPGAGGGATADTEPDETGTDTTNGAGNVATNAGAVSEGKTVFLIGDKTLAADLTSKVSAKVIPAESARSILTEMVGLSAEDASAIIGPAESFEIQQQSASDTEATNA